MRSLGLKLAVRAALVVPLVGCLAVLHGCGTRADKNEGADLEWLITAGKLADAENLCRKNVQSSKGDVDALGALARVLCLRGNATLREAGFFEKKTARDSLDKPEYAPAVEFFRKAAAEAETALQKDAKRADIRGTLGLALYRSGQTERAVQELKQARQDLEQRRQDLDRKREELERARKEVKQGREAQAKLDQEIRDAQARLGQDASNLAQILNTLGLISHETGKRDDALAYYQAALAVDSSLPEATYNIAVLYHQEYDAAGRQAAKEAAVQHYDLYLKRSGGQHDAQARAALKQLSEVKPAGAKP